MTISPIKVLLWIHIVSYSKQKIGNWGWEEKAWTYWTTQMDAWSRRHTFFFFFLRHLSIAWVKIRPSHMIASICPSREKEKKNDCSECQEIISCKTKKTFVLKLLWKEKEKRKSQRQRWILTLFLSGTRSNAVHSTLTPFSSKSDFL